MRGRYPTVNRLSPAEVRSVVKAVEAWNDEVARRGEWTYVVEVPKLMRVLRG